MTQSRDGTRSLLRWYPRAWRERYGDELVALVEDSSGGRAPTPKIKVSIVWAGLREHAHDAGFVGTRRSAPEQFRTGALVVLCAWAGFVLAGASFSKLSEHFAQSVPATSRALPQVAFSVVVVLGAVGATLVLIGGLVALPAFVRFVRSGGWLSLSRHVIRATGLSVIAVCAVIPLSFWAHHLNEIQRNGGDRIYSGAFVTWGLLVAATLTQWTMVGVAAARRIDFAAQSPSLRSSAGRPLGWGNGSRHDRYRTVVGSNGDRCAVVYSRNADWDTAIAGQSSAPADNGADVEWCTYRRLRRNSDQTFVDRTPRHLIHRSPRLGRYGSGSPDQCRDPGALLASSTEVARIVLDSSLQSRRCWRPLHDKVSRTRLEGSHAR